MGGNAKLVEKPELLNAEMPVAQASDFNIQEFLAAVIALGDAINQLNAVQNNRHQNVADEVQIIHEIAIALRDYP